MWQCPACGEKMQDTDDQCWSCKTRNPSLAASPPQEPKSAFGKAIMSEPKKRCPFCAEEILAAAVKCKFCGSVLPAEDKKSAGGYVRMPKAVFALALFFIFAALVTWAWGLMEYFGLRKGATGKKEPAAAAGKTADEKVKGAYEEIIEYDARGNVVKKMKNYEN